MTPQPYSVTNLLVGMPRHLREGRLLMMLKAYFDDSGSHSLGAVYVVAGYIAPVEQWVAFEDEWSSALTLHGLSFLKAEHAHRRSGEFSGRSRERVAQIMEHMSGIIARHASYEVSVQVPRAEFDKAVEEANVLQRPKYRSPYLLCYRELMGLLRPLLPFIFTDQWPGLDVVFDDQALIQGVIQSAAREGVPVGTLVSSTVFGDDKVHLPLQAADVIAWSLHRAYTTGEVPTATRSLMALPAFRIRVDEPRMREFASGLAPAIRSDLAKEANARKRKTKSTDNADRSKRGTDRDSGADA